MFTSIAAVVVGLGVLIWSADRFVDGAAAAARLLGISTLIIGIVVVGFGTSAPEIGVSVIAVLQATPGIAIGNALGSNIANIGLILGVTAILVSIPVQTHLLKTEFPLLMLATAVMAWCLSDLHLGYLEGVLLVIMLLVILYYLIRQHRLHPRDYAELDSDTLKIAESSIEPARGLTLPQALLWILTGLVLLVVSSKALVWGASNIAREFGISELIIGLTIVALGTSLPELAASIASLKKNVPDVAIGNVIGSNLFNSLAVVGIPAMLAPFHFERSALVRDLPVVIGLTVVLMLMCRFPGALPRHLTRGKGILLFVAFVIYQLYLYHEVIAGL
jgi:cation:H+ antiporter